MKRLVYCVALTFMALAGCKPAANTVTDGGEETPVVENSNGETTPPKTTEEEQVKFTDLPKDPARDLTAEQQQVDAMDIEALVAALGDDKLYNVAADELATRGPDAVAPVIAALDSADPEQRQTAIFVLGRFEKLAAPALPKLKQIAADDNQSEEVIDSAKYAIDAIEGN